MKTRNSLLFAGFVFLVIFLMTIGCVNSPIAGKTGAKGKLDQKTGAFDPNIIEVFYSEALGDAISISKGTMQYSYVTGYVGDTEGVSGNFSAAQTTVEKELKSIDIKNLVEAFYKNGWENLSEKGYGASPNDRYYPTVMRLKDAKSDKTVTYRSNPGYPEPPGEFYAIIQEIVALKDRYFNK
jgi:hypothetical protein